MEQWRRVGGVLAAARVCALACGAVLLSVAGAAGQPAEPADAVGDPATPTDVVPGGDPAVELPAEEEMSAGAIPGEAVGLTEEADATESVLLNFEDGDIRAVIDSLATALGLSYMIDPRVEGQVTIRTLGRIPKSDLFPVFNRILRNNGIAAVKVGDVYHIVPVGEAKTRAILPPTAARRDEIQSRDSFVIEIVPCQHVASDDMVTVLEPFITPGGDVFSYPRGNLLIVTDLSSNVARVRDLILALDTDSFRGMRTRTFKLKHGDVDMIYEELGALLGSYGHAIDGSTGLTLIPMPRLESLTAISFDSSVFTQIAHWLEVLDISPEEGAGRKVRVYHVENVKAADLATILNELFGGGGGSGTTGLGGFGAGIRGGAIAQGRQAFGRPGRTTATGAPTAAGRTATQGRMSTARQQTGDNPVTAAQQTTGQIPSLGGARGTRRGAQEVGGTGRSLGGRGISAGQPGGAVGVVLPGGRQGGAGGTFAGLPGPPPIFKEEVRIVADEVTNALVVFATKQDFEMILDVLKEIDVVPRQVLIEVAIAEVTLNKGLEFGVDHAVRWGGSIRKVESVRNFGAGATDSGDDDTGDDDTDTTTPTLGSLGDALFALANPGAGGLTAFVTNEDDFAVLLRALASKSAVKILSAPHIIAADNREAHIQVGQSIPILTGSQTNLASTTNNVFNQIQYRDTGTILTILPQVNSAGLVNMQVTQEVSAVGSENFGATNSPSFLTREAETTMVVQDGDSILIGGIIDEQRQTSRSGVPFIMDIPVLGRLFRLERSNHTRTELLILITPHVIRNRDEGLLVTDRFRRGVKGLEGLMDWVRRDAPPPTAPERSDEVEEVGPP